MARRLAKLAFSLSVGVAAEELLTPAEADARVAAAADAAHGRLESTARADVARPPLFLVPGLTGSALEARLSDAPMPHSYCETNTKGKWENIWLNPADVVPFAKDCLIAKMTLTYDATTDTYSNLPGVELRATDFGSSEITSKLYDYEFGSMLKHLGKTMGYTAGQDVWLAPYDWRLAGDAHSKQVNGVGGYYGQLQQLIEEKVKALGKRAVVVSHSLGCPTMLYFFHNYVSTEWKEQYMAGWLALSGPFLGSSMQVDAYLSGFTFGMPTWLVPHDYVRPVQINASSGVWLSPDAMAFEDMIILETPTKNYTAADLPDILETLGDEQAMAIMKKFSGQLAGLQKAPDSLEVEHWYSTGVKTAESFKYDTEITRGYDEAPSKTVYGDGDGIVNILSLRSVERFWNESARTRVFPGNSHFGMLSDVRVLGNLTEYLSRQGQRIEAVVV